MTSGSAAAGRRSGRPWRTIVAVVALLALLALYVWQVAGRARALIATGEPVAVGIGVGVLALPVVVVVLVVRELQLATTVQRMADELSRAGELPVDDLPRSPGGRIDRDAADAAFEPFRAAAEQDPQDWKARYALAFAYDASRDRRRARASLREAARLYRRSGTTG